MSISSVGFGFLSSMAGGVAKTNTNVGRPFVASVSSVVKASFHADGKLSPGISISVSEGQSS